MTDTHDPAEQADQVITEDGAPGEADNGESLDLREEVEQLRAQYQRAMADYQNLQRRSREERLEVGQFAIAEVVRGFLPVLDDLQRAIEAAEADEAGSGDAAWLEGIRLVAQKFQGALEQHGIQEIHALGQPFDPTKHEAVGSAPGPEGQVVHLLQRGYVLRERVVRPAMVMVGNGEGASAGTDRAAGTDGGESGSDATG